jgi:hypothetical protein
MRLTPALAVLPFASERAPARSRARARNAARRNAFAGMLPLYALVLAAAGALTSHFAPVLGAWPMLTVLACPLLQLTARRD